MWYGYEFTEVFSSSEKGLDVLRRGAGGAYSSGLCDNVSWMGRVERGGRTGFGDELGLAI